MPVPERRFPGSFPLFRCNAGTQVRAGNLEFVEFAIRKGGRMVAGYFFRNFLDAFSAAGELG